MGTTKKARYGVAAGIGVTVFAGVIGSAASLGGITGTSLGADDTVVASCDTDGVSVSYTNAYDATDGRYEVGSVTVDGLAAACDGLSMKVTASGAGNASLAEGTVTVPTGAGTTATASFSSTPSAENVTGVHVVIS